MKPFDRRTFLAGGAAAGLLSGLGRAATASEFADASGLESPAASVDAEAKQANADVSDVDFRYAPTDFQSTICFPDDPNKTVISKRGEFRYDFPADIFASPAQFGTIVEFTLAGMGQDAWIDQQMESPATPIVHTRLKRGAASIELISFATQREEEGRVDNVQMEVRTEAKAIIASPLIRIRSCTDFRLSESVHGMCRVMRADEQQPWLVGIPQSASLSDGDIMWRKVEGGYELFLSPCEVRPDAPLRMLFRVPQRSTSGKLNAAVSSEELLDEARSWWRRWHAFGGDVDWSLPGAHGEFLVACARNIQQAREVKNEHTVFEVGPTVYRGMWIVDGNFLLEAARYLGYDDAADKGLLSEWNQQNANGQIVASAGKEHWKDTAIAMFTLVRACELKQDWSMLRQLAPKVGHAVDFLIGLRDEARKGNSPNGRYGLLAPGFPDGGMGGVHFEFTNTLWALAGLRAVAAANESLKLLDLNRAAPFYADLKSAFDRAAADEMIDDLRGFRYLPMLMHADPAMQDRNEWTRPRPQTSQWPLSHTIFPGEVFAKDDPIVRGHIALMQACTQEDIPAETGWIHHEGVWNYNAPFVAQVYLWAGLRDWAHRTFTGYLNHASPLRAWREEQPLQHSLLGAQWGDMPHNWASAECIRYLRHMLVLEDGRDLRLLEGVMPSDLDVRRPFTLKDSPTRFGRVSLEMEPTGNRGWKLHFRRSQGPKPATIFLRSRIVPQSSLTHIQGATSGPMGNDVVSVDPAASEWTATWN